MEYRAESNIVFFSEKIVTTITEQDLGFLHAQAKKTERNKSRLCIHKSINDKLHEMIVAYQKGCYVRPHKQQDRTVSYHIIEGKVILCLFDHEGYVKQKIEMGDYNSGLCFYLRLPSHIYRSMIVCSDQAVFQEVTSGPFKLGNTVYAPWAPCDSKKDEAAHYLNELITKEGLL